MILRFALSALAIVALAVVAWLLGLGRDRPIGSADAAMRAAEHALSGFAATGALVGGDGHAAIVAGAAGRLAIVKRHGAHVAVREVTGAAIADAPGGAVVDSGERRFGRVAIAGVDRAAIERLAAN